MSNNGTDRDVALSIVSALNSCAELITGINDNLYVPHITTQPTDQEVAIGEDATFTVAGNNIAAYQWQYKQEGYVWQNSASTGSTTASLTVTASETRYGYKYRCKITGKDGSTIYSNEVRMIEPEANG